MKYHHFTQSISGCLADNENAEKVVKLDKKRKKKYQKFIF